MLFRQIQKKNSIQFCVRTPKLTQTPTNPQTHTHKPTNPHPHPHPNPQTHTHKPTPTNPQTHKPTKFTPTNPQNSHPQTHKIHTRTRGVKGGRSPPDRNSLSPIVCAFSSNVVNSHLRTSAIPFSLEGRIEFTRII